MPGKSPMKLEVTSRHDHSCLLGRKALKQTNKHTKFHGNQSFGSGEEDLKGFLPYMCGAAILIM